MKRKRHTAAWICLAVGLSVWMHVFSTYWFLMTEFSDKNLYLREDALVCLDDQGRYFITLSVRSKTFYIEDYMKRQPAFARVTDYQVLDQKVYIISRDSWDHKKINYGVLDMREDDAKRSALLEDFTPAEREILENKDQSMINLSKITFRSFFTEWIPPCFRLQWLRYTSGPLG